jgi:hypothetical protein
MHSLLGNKDECGNLGVRLSLKRPSVKGGDSIRTSDGARKKNA